MWLRTIATGALCLGSGCTGDDGGATPTTDTTAASTSDDTGGVDSSSSSGGGSTTGSADGTTSSTGTTVADSGSSDSGGSDGSSDGGSSSTGAASECGDGMRDPGEACDDGNEIEADGCNNDCTVSGSVLWEHSQASGTGNTDDAYAVAVDADGRAHVAGETFGAGVDFWVRQYTEDGGLGWTVTMDGGAALNEGARAAVLDGATLYVVGYANVAGQSNNVVLRSFDAGGGLGLDVMYNDPLNGSNVGQGVAVDPMGNIVVAANESVAMQGSNIWAREYTPAGATAWTVGYGGPALSTDQARAVATDAMGNVAVAGYHTVTGQGRDVWVRVYDTAGAEQWTGTYGNANALDDEALGVAFDSMGNVVVAGFELDPVIPWRLFLRKYDPGGAELWTMPWDGDTGEGARAFGVTIDAADDIIITGQHREGGFSQLLVRKYDPDGNPRWTTSLEGAPMTNQVGRSVTTGPDNRVWVAGGFDLGIDGRDAYVVRLAP